MLEQLSALLRQTLQTANLKADRARVEADPDDPDRQSLLLWYPTATTEGNTYIRRATRHVRASMRRPCVDESRKLKAESGLLARRCNRFTLGSARRDHEHHRAGGKLLKPIVIPSDACLRPGIIRTECARLHGVISLTPNALPVLKRHAFIFDKFHLTDLNQELSWTLIDDVAPSLKADLAFLQEKNLIAWLPHRKATMKQTAVRQKRTCGTSRL
jgi:hypothetical protein